MPFPECQPGPSGSSKKEHGFVCMSTTVDDLSYTPSEQEKSRDEAQFVATGRKSWKTLKGKGEAVWPPMLEASLLEALVEYNPDVIGAKPSKIHGRFPMRNRFISDYIFEHTGKRRTPKQVGSRLQQLRDTCKEDQILLLISRRSPSERASTGSPSAADSQSDCSTEASPSPSPESILPSSTKPLHVNIVLQKELWPSLTPLIDFVKEAAPNPQSIQLAPCPSSPGRGLSADSTILPFLAGTVDYTFPCPLVLQTTFVVYANTSMTPIHVEQSQVTPLPSSTNQSGSGHRYSVELVPGFWGRLCSSRDVTQYTILHTLKPVLAQSPQTSPRSFSIIYKFSDIHKNAGEYSRSTYSLASSTSQYTAPAPIDSNSAWNPSSDNAEFDYSNDQEQGYHVETSYRLLSANPSVPSITPPSSRCNTHDSTSRALVPKYEPDEVASQWSGTYYSTSEASCNFHVDAYQYTYHHHPLHHGYSNC